MHVSDELRNTEFESTDVYVVGRDIVRELASAVMADDAIHHDVDAAKAAGYDDLVAPPTFTALVQAEVIKAMMDELGVSPDPHAMVAVHTAEKIVVEHPIVAGDRLRASIHITDVIERGPASFVSTVSVVRDEKGSPRATIESSIVVSPHPNEAA